MKTKSRQKNTPVPTAALAPAPNSKKKKQHAFSLGNSEPAFKEPSKLEKPKTDVFDGLIYARDPMQKGLVEIVIKGTDGELVVIKLDALKGAHFGTLLADMGIVIYQRGMK